VDPSGPRCGRCTGAELEGQDGLRVTDPERSFAHSRPPSVTGVIDRLERIHLVVRDPVRMISVPRFVRLTDTGRQLVAKVTGVVYATQVERALGGLVPEDQNELQRLLGRLSAHLQSLLDESNGADPGARPVTEMNT